MSAVSVLWTLLSAVGLFTSSLALFSPFWHEHIPDANLTNNNKSFIAFGLLRFCLQDQFVTLQEINEFKDSEDCSFYEGLFSGIPSVFWKVAAIIYTTAILLQVVALLLAHIFCCQKFVCGKVITKVAAVIQSAAVFLLLVSVIIYWCGLNSSFVKQHCGPSSSYFNPGTCQIAWGCVLATVSAALLIFCPLLAHHVAVTTPRSKEMDNLNSEVLKFPVQESCGEEEEKDSRPEEIKEKMRRLENGSHSEELSFRSTLENTSSVAQSLDHDTETFLLPYGIQCTEDVEKFEGVQAGSSLKHFKRTNKWFVIRDRKRQFWEVKLPEFPAQPFKKRRIENGDPRARKQILPRGCKRKFGEVKDRKSPSQPLKKKKIGNEGGRLVERSEKGCRTHWGHENNHPCSNLFDPGGSHQANSQVGEMGVIHLVFALQILRL